MAYVNVYSDRINKTGTRANMESDNVVFVYWNLISPISQPSKLSLGHPHQAIKLIFYIFAQKLRNENI